jgi:glycosyltransferase involved in cell wall biosynthesis
MPAYNAAKTLHMTYAELPHQSVDLVIVVDDGSSDETVQIARELGLEIFVHDRNYGYGAIRRRVTARRFGPGRTSWSWFIRIINMTRRYCRK